MLRPWALYALISPRWLRIQFKVAVLMYKVLHGCMPSYLSSFVRISNLWTPPASSSHGLTVPPLATKPFQLLVPRCGIVCHWRSHQHHPWTPSAGVWRPISSHCRIRTISYVTWLTLVSGPCSNSLLRPLWKSLIDWPTDWDWLIDWLNTLLLVYLV